MKILKASLETRYEELRVVVTCEKCGAELEAEGHEIRNYRANSYGGNPEEAYFTYGLAVQCPCCHQLIAVSRRHIPDDKLREYMERQAPTYIKVPPIDVRLR